MITGGLIEAICSVMGFAFVMKYTECDKHLIHLVANALTKVRPLLIPGRNPGHLCHQYRFAERRRRFGGGGNDFHPDPHGRRR